MSAVELAPQALALPYETPRAKPLPLAGPASFYRILEAVQRSTGVETAMLLSTSRVQWFADARHVAMWLAYRCIPSASYPGVAALFKRDHTTIISAVRKIDRAIQFGDTGVTNGAALARRAQKLAAELGGMNE